MLQGKSALTPHGVSGLGMGIVYGSIEIENSEKEGYYEVDDCTINPALLPGFEWVSKDSNDPEEPDGSFRIAKTDWEQYSRIFVQGVPSAGRKMTIKPTLILWAYDDEELNDGNVSEPPDSLRCLAAASLGPNDVYSPLSTPLDAFYFTRIVTQVREHEGDNKIRAWIASQRPPKYGVPTIRNTTLKQTISSIRMISHILLNWVKFLTISETVSRYPKARCGLFSISLMAWSKI